MAWPSIRTFLGIPDHLTGRDVVIALVDGTFAGHPDISDGSARRSRRVLAGQVGAEPEAVGPVVEPWPAGAHGLWGAAAAGGTGAATGGAYAGAAPEADLLLVAGYLEGVELTDHERQLVALRWLRDNWRRYEVRGVVTAIAGEYGSALLPWQSEPLRVACEELCAEGLLVVAGTGNTPDGGARITQAAAPSVLAVGGVVVPASGRWQAAAAYHGCRGTTFEGKRKPEVLAPADNLVLPYLGSEDPDVPPGYLCMDGGTSAAGPIILGAAACLWQAHPEWSATRVRQALIAPARRWPAWRALRAGLVDVEASVWWRAEPGTPAWPPYARYVSWRRGAAPARIAAAADAAVEALLSFLPDQVTDEVALACVKLLGSGSPVLTAAALCVLAARPEHISVELLAPHLADANVYVRAAALRAVRAAPHVWEALTPGVGRRLSDTDPDVSQAAAHLAGEMRAVELVPALVESLAEDIGRRRPACLVARTRALERLTGEAFPPQPEWRAGEPLFDDRWWLAREGVAASWREWLATGGRGFAMR